VLRNLIPAVTAAFAALCICCQAAAEDAADFYRGRTVTVLVGSGPGGATDISARVIARYLEKHMPGGPTVIVKNMPGGGSVTMTNYVYRSAPRDGTVLGYSLPGILTAQLLEPQRARFDGTDINWIGSVMKYTGIISVLATAPATTIEQAKHTELFIGTTGRGSPAYQFPAMAQALLGLKFNIIAGYESSNDVALAMERGEVHGQSSSLEYWALSRPEWLNNGKIVHLLYVGPPNPLGTPGVPYLRDLVTSERDKALVDFIEIGSNLGWPLFAPPGVPAAELAGLRAAFADLVDDPEFVTAFETTVKGRVNPASAEELGALVARALATPQEILLEAKKILGLD
jgi:tripartite-type tricarboxylate transporter receptor subunit TctC